MGKAHFHNRMRHQSVYPTAKKVHTAGSRRIKPLIVLSSVLAGPIGTNKGYLFLLFLLLMTGPTNIESYHKKN